MAFRFFRHLAVVTALLSSLAACASTPATHKTLAVGTSITLQQGERAALPDGSTIQYVGLAADSRCPEKVQCIWAGDADVSFMLASSDGASRAVHLHTNSEPKSIRASGHTLTLEAVTRGSEARATIRLIP